MSILTMNPPASRPQKPPAVAAADLKPAVRHSDEESDSEDMVTDGETAYEAALLQQIADAMRARGYAPVPVVNGRITASLTMESLCDLLMVNAAIAHCDTLRQESAFATDQSTAHTFSNTQRSSTWKRIRSFRF